MLQVSWVRKLEPSSRHYAGVYSETGLMRGNSVLAHCVHLSDEELDLIGASGAGVAHCPNSNSSIRSGRMDVRKMQARGIKIGLGTDCAAGYSPSIIDAMRYSVAHVVTNVHRRETSLTSADSP